MAKILRKEKGFTLIELIIAVAILAVLAGMALLNSGITENDARDAVLEADFHTLATAIKVYKIKTGSLPADLNALTVDSGQYKAMIDAVPDDPYDDPADAGTAYEFATAAGSFTILSDKPASKVVK